MKLTLGRLRRLVREAKISASPEYLKKEAIRERIQKEIVDAVSSGEITDQQQLTDLFKTHEMALSALRMVSFEVFEKIAGKHHDKTK